MRVKEGKNYTGINIGRNGQNSVKVFQSKEEFKGQKWMPLHKTVQFLSHRDSAQFIFYASS